jgi:hypothetical protein
MRGSCDGNPLGCSVKLRCRNRGMVWAKLRWLEPTSYKRGLLGGCDAHTGGETSVGMLKLDETIEQSCSDFLAHTLEVCKSACRYNEYSAIWR